IGTNGRQAVGSDLTSVLGHVTLLRRERLVVATTRPAYAATVVATGRGREPRLLGLRSVTDVARALQGVDSALLQTRGQACRSTALDDQDDGVLDQARVAVARAGRLVDPLIAGRGLVEGRPRQSIRFALGFDSPATAARQLLV